MNVNDMELVRSFLKESNYVETDDTHTVSFKEKFCNEW